MTATQLGKLTKELNPEINSEDWELINQKAAMGEAAAARLATGYRNFCRLLRTGLLNFNDSNNWGEPIQDIRGHLKDALHA